jgi:hypothetical protein
VLSDMLGVEAQKTRDTLCFGTKRESFDPGLPAQVATRALPPAPAADCGHSGEDGMPGIKVLNLASNGWQAGRKIGSLCRLGRLFDAALNGPRS